MQGTVEGKRIAALVGDGFEEAELSEPRKVLESAGAIVTIVGVDDASRTRIRSKRDLDEGTPVKAEELVADCTADDFDALLIPGGLSPEKIRANREVQRFVREFDAAKKPIFSIGSGAHVLISAQVTRGKILTGSAAIGDDIRNSGGLFRDTPVAQDGHWVSARNVADLPQFGRAMLERLSAAVSSPAG
jgi:protease I